MSDNPEGRDDERRARTRPGFYPALAMGFVILLMGAVPDFMGQASQARFVLLYGGLGIILAAVGTNAKVSNGFMSLTGAGAIVVLLANLVPPDYDRAFIGHINTTESTNSLNLTLNSGEGITFIRRDQQSANFFGRENPLAQATHAILSVQYSDSTGHVFRCIPVSLIQNLVGQRQNISLNVTRQFPEQSQLGPVVHILRVGPDHSDIIREPSETLACPPVKSALQRSMERLGRLIGVSAAQGQTAVDPEAWRKLFEGTLEEQSASRSIVAARMNSEDIRSLINRLSELPDQPTPADVRQADSIFVILNSIFSNRPRETLALLGRLENDQLLSMARFMGGWPRQIWTNSTLFFANFASINGTTRRQIVEVMLQILQQSTQRPINLNIQLNAVALFNGLTCQNSRQLLPYSSRIDRSGTSVQDERVGLPQELSQRVTLLFQSITQSGSTYPSAVKDFATRLFNDGMWTCQR